MPPIDLPMKEDRRAVARERHGLFRCGAFAAARVRRPSIQNIRERYSDHSPRPRIPGRLTSCRLVSSAPHLGFLSDPHCPAVWPVCHRPPGKLPVCLGAGLFRRHLAPARPGLFYPRPVSAQLKCTALCGGGRRWRLRWPRGRRLWWLGRRHEGNPRRRET